MSDSPLPCRLGRYEYDRARYCYEHGGFIHGGERGNRCDRADGEPAVPAPDPDPCCVHETLLDTAIHDLARAHGRPENAERIARGLPPTTNKARHEHVAGLTTSQEDA